MDRGQDELAGARSVARPRTRSLAVIDPEGRSSSRRPTTAAFTTNSKRSGAGGETGRDIAAHRPPQAARKALGPEPPL